MNVVHLNQKQQRAAAGSTPSQRGGRLDQKPGPGRLVNRNEASRELACLAKRGRLMRVFLVTWLCIDRFLFHRRRASDSHRRLSGTVEYVLSRAVHHRSGNSVPRFMIST